ncbi:IclR family transcriptional regulator [Affinirhizobium pseudoryzae]|uniref:IclR family transcriptional regulator n=1 Tax=Allorhizobium pseudoryzae TaxID=379684 RepID=UPI0013EA7E89|nr:IclR family transcriptional regulator [Allorhizobium pseudoryzae]
MDKDAEKIASGGTAVPALRRAVEILNLLATSDERFSSAEISRRLSLPKSTAHGLLSAMIELNLIRRSADGTMRIGPQSVRWAGRFLSQMDVRTAFNDYLDTNRQWSAYTVTLTLREGPDVIYIACRNSERPLGHTFSIGTRLPAAFTATGKVLLSELPEDDLDNLFSAGLPTRLTSNSVQTLEQLKGELALVRSRGFSVDDGQIRAGMVCVGAPVRDHDGDITAGIAVSFLRSDLKSQGIAAIGEQLKTAGHAISRRLGAT